jgi:phosphate-selective porin OprO/OprP
MVTARIAHGGWALLALSLCSVGVWAQDAAGPVGADEADRVARLESLLAAQQQEIDALRQQAAAAARQDTDRLRVDQMKQQIREVLSEREFRESLMPSTLQAGYDNGFFIRSSDEKFSIKFNWQMQFRWTHYGTRGSNRYLSPGFRRHDRTGFDIVRMNFDVSGHAYDKDLTYFMELGAAAPGGYDVVLNYAWVNYRFSDAFQFRAGLIRSKSTRANVTSNALYQMVESPTMDAVFGLNDGLGVEFWGQLAEKRVEYFINVLNSVDNPATQTITTDENLYAVGHDNNPALLARVVWHALGGQCRTPLPDAPAHFDDFCDMAHHMEPGLDLGFHYMFNEDWHDGTLRIPYPRQNVFRAGGFGLASSEGLQINQFGLDAAFKYQGFSATGEYVVRVLDVRSGSRPPFTPLYQVTGDDSTNAQHGAYVQCGYFLPIPGWEDKFEVTARVGGISALAGGSEGTWEYAGGFNYYIEGHRVKLQTDLVKISEVPISNPTWSLANVNDDALIWRVQLQVAF